MSQAISIQDNGNESFTMHSSIINMKWAYDHIDPFGDKPSQLVKYKEYWKYEPTLVNNVYAQ